MGLREKLSRFDGSDKSSGKALEASKDKAPEEDDLPSYTEAESSSSQSPQFQSRFASLSLHGYDMIRLLHFPTPIIDLCRDIVQQTWTRKIKSETEYSGCHQFKLHGFPWTGSGGQTTEARRMICRLLEVLHGQGWVLMISTSISKKQMEKDTMLFRHQIPSPAPCDWCAIGFSKMDRIRFMDAPQELPTLLSETLGSTWIKDRTILSPGVHEIKLEGSPWYCNGTKTMEVRKLLLTFLEVLESEGWSVYASVDQKDAAQDYSETDTWHCCRPKGWVRGAPVYHG